MGSGDYIAFFAVSQRYGLSWVYLGRFRQVRGKGQGLGCATHWIMNAILSGLFPVIAAQSGGYPFAFFAVMMALQFFVVLFFFPETKQVSLEDLQRMLKIE